MPPRSERHRLLDLMSLGSAAALALAGAMCGGNVVGAGSATTAGAGGNTTTGGPTGGGGDGGSGGRGVISLPAGCVLTVTPQPDETIVEGCIPVTAAGCDPLGPAAQAALAASLHLCDATPCCQDAPLLVQLLCGPYTEGESCCYELLEGPRCG